MADSMAPAIRVHSTAAVDAGAIVGAGTSVWHFSHVMAGAVVGTDCVIGQGCFVAAGAVIGCRVKLQNHVSVFDGVELEDEVFCGPGAVFTNVVNPRAAVSRRHEYRHTLVKRGATVGANATVIAGVTIGEYAFVGAGATVVRDVPAFALVTGVPAKRAGWMSRRGERLEFDAKGNAACPSAGDVYRLSTDGGVVLVSAGARGARG